MTDIKTRVDQFVKLRDLIRAKDDEHKNNMKPLKETLEQLNAVLLKHLDELGGESVKTDSGTVYRTERKNASLADAEAFMDFVVRHGAFDLLDRKANVTAVEDYINDHDAPPPGVNFTKTFVVGVRRA